MKKAKKLKAFSIRVSDKVKIRAAVQQWPPQKADAPLVLDIRTYVVAKGGEDFIPTQKGVQIPAEKVGYFLEKLLQLVGDAK